MLPILLTPGCKSENMTEERLKFWCGGAEYSMAINKEAELRADAP